MHEGMQNETEREGERVDIAGAQDWHWETPRDPRRRFTGAQQERTGSSSEMKLGECREKIGGMEGVK